MKKKNKTQLFGIIGLGRFGSALAEMLADAGKELLVIDNNETKISNAKAYTDFAYLIKNLTKESLEEAGVKNCDTVIVCIGEKLADFPPPRILDYIALSDEVNISEVMLTEKADRITILQLNLRERFGLNVIAVKHMGEIATEIGPQMVLYQNDTVVVIGKTENIQNFETFLEG